MSTVETMRGPVDSSQLGRVLVHEHIFLGDPEYIANYRPDFDEDAMVEDAVARCAARSCVWSRPMSDKPPAAVGTGSGGKP